MRNGEPFDFDQAFENLESQADGWIATEKKENRAKKENRERVKRPGRRTYQDDDPFYNILEDGESARRMSAARRAKSYEEREDFGRRTSNRRISDGRIPERRIADRRDPNRANEEWNGPERRIADRRAEDREKKNGKQKKGRVKVSLLSKFLRLLQGVSSVLLLACLVILNIFPWKYLLATAAFLLLFYLFTGFVQKVKAKRGNGKGGRILSLLIITVCLLGCFYVLKVNAAVDRIAVDVEGEDFTNAGSIDVTEQNFNIYISGIDVYGDIDQESRSDVNLVATVCPGQHKILLTTTPRDYYVTIPGVSGEERDKLTHAGNYGVSTSMATLANLYETELPFYIRVNFTTVEDVVDLIGGVDVESDEAFTTSKAAGEIVDVKQGMNHFNGKQALAFVRERKALAMGDNSRGIHQQALLKAMIEKIASPQIILHANGLINSVSGNAETNLTEDQMKSLIRMQLNHLEGWDIESVAAEGDPSGKKMCFSYPGKELYVTVPYERSVSEIREKIRSYLSMQ